MHFPEDIKDKYLAIAAQVGLKAEDVEEHFTAGGGHGGQKVNKSQNCVELTHKPTGTTVRFHQHRGLHRNRVEAWQLLILKIQEQILGDKSKLGQEKHKIEKQKQRRSRRSKQKMLEEKRRESEVKEFRKPVEEESY
ncbi:peptide chain release factor-like protein [Candidatus Peregrinibacteria bacterium]|nr:peptide chain release factor-like protein [Candidatus Peregrinibacteria bacterium]